MTGCRLLAVWLCVCAWTVAAAHADEAPSSPPPVNVVLVHGFLNSGRVFNRMARELEREGCHCFAPTLRPKDGTSGIDDLTGKLAARIDAHFGPRARFFMVGFSMGGLVVRDYVQNTSNRERVRGVFLIATGSRGTLWARFSPNAHQREMASGSTFLRSLDADDSAWKMVPVHAYWTPLDLMIVPSVNTRWPEGETTRVTCVLHPWMVRNKVVIADIAARVKTLSAASAASKIRYTAFQDR